MLLPHAELNQQFGSFLAGADQFDAAALGVSPAEALLMDPQQRLVMQSFSGEGAIWQAFSTALCVSLFEQQRCTPAAPPQRQ